MKQFLLLFTLLISALGFAQFPETEAQLLVGKEIKVVPSDNAKMRGYQNFYSDYEFKKKFDGKFDVLAGKTFNVDKADPYKSSTGKDKFKLTLSNSDLGVLYFDYSTDFYLNFPFEVIGGLTMPDGYYCKYVTTETDKFNGDIRSTTKFADGITFMKVVSGGKTTISMFVSVLSPTAVAGKQGVILLLANGKKIEKPQAPLELDANVKGGSNFRYTATFTLTPADIKLLTESPITDKRLYLFDDRVGEGYKLMNLLKCLSK